MDVRSFVAGLSVAVVLSMGAGCASSAQNAQPARVIDARAVAAPEIAPPPEQSEWSLQYAPEGAKENPAAQENNVSTVLKPSLATKKDKRTKDTDKDGIPDRSSDR